MRKKYKDNKGQTTIEYIMLIVSLLVVFLLIQKYAVLGIYGQWKKTGDSLSGETGLYDPEKTLECEYDYAYGTNSWYNSVCYEENNCYRKCVDGLSTCQGCITGCHVSMCDD